MPYQFLLLYHLVICCGGIRFKSVYQIVMILIFKDKSKTCCWPPMSDRKHPVISLEIHRYTVGSKSNVLLCAELLISVILSSHGFCHLSPCTLAVAALQSMILCLLLLSSLSNELCGGQCLLAAQC